VTDAEIDSLIAFNLGRHIDNGDWRPGQQRLTKARNDDCGAGVSPERCLSKPRLHELPYAAERRLAGARYRGRKMDKEQIEHYVRDPKSVNPKALMPPQKDLSEKELEAVAKFLANLK
jgi:nitric oxide reductase subunit C